MPNKAREKIRKDIALWLPSFRRNGNLLHPPPSEDILVGLVIEGSSNPDRFYLWTLVMPLFIPADHLHMTFGFRVGPGLSSGSWSLSDFKELAKIQGRIESVALPFLDRVSNLPGLTIHLAHLQSSRNPHVSEALGACLARADRIDDALKEWSKTETLVDVAVVWQRDLLERVKQVEQLFRSDRSMAQAELDGVVSKTRKALKIAAQ